MFTNKSYYVSLISVVISLRSNNNMPIASIIYKKRLYTNIILVWRNLSKFVD